MGLRNLLRIISGIVFIIFGIIILINNKEDKAKCELNKPFLSGFTMILVSEMGDKTQIASGLFAVKYNALMVFSGVIISLSILSLMAIYFGKFIVKRLNSRLISNLAGILFLIIGIFCFF